MAEPGDQAWMRRAIALAQVHLGRTGDNPSVGCVIVADGVAVGEGATGVGGRPHAEEVALDQAGAAAKGATAYVTLEPCAERSSGAASCSELLARAGVARVVVACKDASVLAAGRGTERLRAAGVTVELGVAAQEAAQLYGAYKPKA
ncbi:bifunctional diaminohydroxyphosphoribosylaminopyrimidine deaminase/5-amino-6-(5-phosphoribosylamino)uracil reductase RibD [Phenylobacterium sp.]|uniref:bifunctional diaminohydroxyphosphoribosylaminopyrimidine deaminase/5-amino-6-(5-phosphoribosylamino)uracil reductase RibD n=1 Tax=Phenylobacterium sp. TaxID=1871053 RepID=UPI0012054A9F|nr:bifunctional diaminohydroxyphosphoribosylaminopyrimidine deaminase/5-amino-6-(5-phosphoribosylamino)uracil reductase RibD [Phenylobacterium sp.]THD64676.1 MAG: riboflavin biosynthesis protein RibD [Phenylobacterium sp.]